MITVCSNIAEKRGRGGRDEGGGGWGASWGRVGGAEAGGDGHRQSGITVAWLLAC